MHMETQGLVLRVADTGESDRVLTILTRDYGVLRAFANGAKKLKSRSQSATQALAYSRFSIYRNRDSYIIDEAQGIELFFSLREDIVRLSLAQYFCELACLFAPENQGAEDYLQLLLHALHLLTKQSRPAMLLKAAVELRMLCLSGYQPDVSACKTCREPELPGEFVIWNLQEGTIACRTCGGEGVQIGMGVLAALRHICSALPERLFAFALPEPSLRLLCTATEEFLLSQSAHRFRTLEFYKSLTD